MGHTLKIGPVPEGEKRSNQIVKDFETLLINNNGFLETSWAHM